MHREIAPARRSLLFAAAAAVIFMAGSGAARLRAQTANQKGKLSSSELKTLIATAKEPADHEKLAAYYRTKAEEAKATVAEHQAMLAAYEKNPASHMPMKTAGPDYWCQQLIRINTQEEKADLNLAAYHEKMAKEAAEKK